MDNDLVIALLVFGLMVVSFLFGGFVFSPTFRSQALTTFRRLKAQKPKRQERRLSPRPDWARGSEDLIEPDPPPVSKPTPRVAHSGNGGMSVEDARKLLKRKGFNVRKKRSVK